MEALVYGVPDMTCAHCERAIIDEVTIPAVELVEVDLEAMLVTVRGRGLLPREVETAIGRARFAPPSSTGSFRDPPAWRLDVHFDVAPRAGAT